MRAEDIAKQVYEAVQDATQSTDRAQQQADFRLGMSDLGHCHEYARRMIVQEPPSDERDKTAAFLGSIMGAGYEAALATHHPDWHFQAEIVTTLPSGIQILGHPDVVGPNFVWDFKSKDGFEVVKRLGQTEQQRFQLHGYMAGCIDAGLVDPAHPEGLWVANVFIDRSGKEPEPYVLVDEYEPQVVQQIDMWLEDVLYAVRNGEEASRDKPRDWCERWCEYFTSCRLYDTDVTGLIEDEEVLTAIDLRLEARQLEAQAKKLKRQADDALDGVSGHTATHTLRWIEVDPTDIPAHTRAGYRRLDLRAKPKGNK